MNEHIIKTERLILRAWKEEDLAPFAEMNADPKVREFFPSVLTKDESDKLAKAISDEITNNGYGFWAVSAPGVSDFIGFVGIRPVDFTAHFTPNVEIGWRLARQYWGKGYATEGAKACLEYGFKTLGLKEIVAFTVPPNTNSRNVMEKIGMHRSENDDFNHPKMDVIHPLCKHVLYRMTFDDYILNSRPR